MGTLAEEIDWMALNGINSPCQLQAKKLYGVKYIQLWVLPWLILKIFYRPGYFAWGWMGNIDGWGGPLPQHWIDTHKELQKK
uniref:NAGLU n=1 Tax=uncultured Chitinophaga sp. TaxID=339340 RepID=A0A060BMZ4_9BACT|nr:NAGLU [uncultured Chitinophaga sp.]